MLELRDVTIRRGDDRLFAPLTCRIAPGRPLTVMGPSGAGKSSLLAWLTGVLPAGLAGEGDVLLDGASVLDLPAHRRRLGILFQDDLLFPHMTVGENLAFGLSPNVRGSDRVARRSQWSRRSRALSCPVSPTATPRRCPGANAPGLHCSESCCPSHGRCSWTSRFPSWT